jgi:hypothetical protein
MTDPVRFILAEPPALNAMLALAKKRAGRFSVVYAAKKDAYEQRAIVDMRNQARRPRSPWRRWKLVRAHFRLWNHRDPLELLAGLKWPVDALVAAGYVEDDSHHHLLHVCTPTQEIARGDRGVEIEVAEAITAAEAP